VLKINLNGGKRYTFATHVNDVLLPREEAEAMEAFRVVIEPGRQTPAHTHDDAEQVYYVISGSGRGVFNFPDGGREEVHMLPQDIVHVPRNAEHQVFCTSEDEPLVYLCVDGFPLGKPADEQTWEQHYQAVVKSLSE